MVIKLKRFLKSLQFIFRPSFWIVQGKYDASFDYKLRLLAKSHTFEYISHSTAVTKLGSIYVWSTNYPYGIFHQCIFHGEYLRDNAHKVFDFTEVRPSRLTIFELYPKLQSDLAKANTNQPQE